RGSPIRATRGEGSARGWASLSNNGLHGSNAPHLKSSKDTQIVRQQTRADRARRCTDCLCYLTKTCALFSQPCHLVAVDYPTRTTKAFLLSLTLRAPGHERETNIFSSLKEPP